MHLCTSDSEFWLGNEHGVLKCCGKACCHGISSPTRNAENLPRKLVFAGSPGTLCIYQLCLSKPNPSANPLEIHSLLILMPFSFPFEWCKFICKTSGNLGAENMCGQLLWRGCCFVYCNSSQNK